MLGGQSLEELLTVGPRFVGSPKVKSAFATPVGKATTNTITEIAKILVVFIFFSFQS